MASFSAQEDRNTKRSGLVRINLYRHKSKSEGRQMSYSEGLYRHNCSNQGPKSTSVFRSKHPPLSTTMELGAVLAPEGLLWLPCDTVRVS
jgi:hypothetical protein